MKKWFGVLFWMRGERGHALGQSAVVVVQENVLKLLKVLLLLLLLLT